MKIEVVRLRENVPEIFEEEFSSQDLDLNTQDVEFVEPVHFITEAIKEFNTVRTKIHFSGKVKCVCSRCLKEFTFLLERDFAIDYPLEKKDYFIDTTKDTREEIIIGYPVKFLCIDNCRGLCFKCGRNLNESKCDCQNNSA